MSTHTRLTNVPIASAFGVPVSSPISHALLQRDPALLFSLRPGKLVRWTRPGTRSLMSAAPYRALDFSAITFDAASNVIYFAGRGFDADSGELVYSFVKSGAVSVQQISVDSAGNRIVLFNRTMLESRSPSDSVNWTVSLGGTAARRFAIDDDDHIVVTGSRESTNLTPLIRKLSSADGSMIWNFSAGEAASIMGLATDVCASGGLVFSSGYFYSLHTFALIATVVAIDGNTGEMLANADPASAVPGAVGTRIATDGSTVALAFGSYAVAEGSTPSLPDHGVSPVSASARGLFALELSLETKWHAADVEPHSVAFDHTGRILAGLSMPSVRRFAADGAAEWGYDCGRLGSAVIASPLDDRLWLGLDGDASRHAYSGASYFWPRIS